jgi:hypothetical protein
LFDFQSVLYLISRVILIYFPSVQQTIWLFFRDLFKGICLAILLGPPIVSAIILIVQVLLSASVDEVASYLQHLITVC